jgi:cytochrome c
MRTGLAASIIAAALLSGGPSFAVDIASPDDAKAMLERTIAALKKDEAAALKAFNDEKNKDFRDRDLYVFCFSLPDGNFTAYLSPVLIGSSVRDLKLPPNDPIGQRAYDAVAKAPEGEVVTVDFTFPKPGTKQMAPKQSLEVRIGNQACGVSYFK